QHCIIVDRDLRVDEYGHDRAEREQNEVRAPADAVVQPRAYEIADERADDNDPEIAAGTHDRELALSPEKRRKPGRDRVITALRARGENAGQDRGLQHFRREDFEEVCFLSCFVEIVLRLLEHLRLVNATADEEN